MHAMAMTSWQQGLPLQYTELPDLPLGGRDVRVAVKFIGVNPADWKMRDHGPLRLAARAVGALRGPKPPVVLGVDFSGVVAEVGARVRSVKIGDRVVGGTNFSRGQRGSYADSVVVREDQVCLVPASVPLDVAGALPVAGVTAWTAVVKLGRIGHNVAGQRVLVLGASGGVGQLCVQVAKKVQQVAVVVGVCSAKNLAMVKSRGADVVLDYTAGDALEQAASHGPFNAIIDCAGGYSPPRCRRLLASGGRHIMVAGDSPTSMLQALVPPFRSRAILGVPDGRSLAPVVKAVADGLLHMPLELRLPLTQANEAHRISQGGRMTGKIILEVEPPAAL